LEEYSRRIRQSLLDAEHEAFRHLGIEPDWQHDEPDEGAAPESCV